MSTTPTWPRLLTFADYARACATVTGKPVARQSISQRVAAGTLPTEDVTVGDKTTRYINTETHPPGPAPGRWANRRPSGSVKLPRRPKPAAS